MLDYLYENNRYDDAIELAKRCSAHDHSKLVMDEVKYFIQLQEEKDNDELPNGVLTEQQRKLIELHWQRNRHHPEYHKDYHDMSEIDIIEMVVDWHSRSCEFGSDFMKFVNSIPKQRFGFDDEFFAKVLQYCEVLAVAKQ
jgi:hypothetical protein